MKFFLNNVVFHLSSSQHNILKERVTFRRFSICIGEKNKNFYKCKNRINNNLYLLSQYGVFKQTSIGGERGEKRYFSFMKNVIEQVKKDMRENKQYQEALKELKEKTEIEDKTTKLKTKIEQNIQFWKRIKEKNVEAVKLFYNDVHTFITYSFENIYILKISKNATVHLYFLIQKLVINGSEKITRLGEKLADNNAFVQLDKWRQEMAIKRYQKQQEKMQKRKEKGLEDTQLGKETETEADETEIQTKGKGKGNMEENILFEKEKEKEEGVVNEEEEKPEKIRNELILAQESAWDRFGSKLKDMPFLNNFFENPMWGKLFGETELAAALREMKIQDKNFKLSELIYLFEYVISKHIVESYLIGDEETLKLHCGTAAFNSLNASINERKKKKVNLDTNVLIYKNHELKGAQRIEESPPWFIFTFHTQQINCLRNHKDEIIEGKIDDIREVVYTIALSKHPKPETEGLLYPYIIREFAIIGNTPSW